MNSKERVTCAINKKQPDITPLGLYVVDHDTISQVLGRRTYLRNRCAMQVALCEGRRDEMVESMKEDVIELYTKIDCVDLLTLKEAIKVPPAGYKPENPPKKLDEHTYEEQNGDIWKLAPESNSIKIISKATEATELKTYAVDEFSDRDIPEPDDPSCYELSDHFMAMLDEHNRLCRNLNSSLRLPGALTSLIPRGSGVMRQGCRKLLKNTNSY